MLILVNGGPGSGKTSVATAVAQKFPLSLHLDIDDLRSHISHWRDQPEKAGLAARSAALAAAAAHAADGHHVIISQFVARPPFADQLLEVAQGTDTTFLHLLLLVDPNIALGRLKKRRDSSDDDPASHDSSEQILAMHDRFRDYSATLLNTQPAPTVGQINTSGRTTTSGQTNTSGRTNTSSQATTSGRTTTSGQATTSSRTNTPGTSSHTPSSASSASSAAEFHPTFTEALDSGRGLDAVVTQALEIIATCQEQGSSR